jgi:hypothetical protein
MSNLWSKAIDDFEKETERINKIPETEDDTERESIQAIDDTAPTEKDQKLQETPK